MFSEYGRGELCSPAGDRRSPLRILAPNLAGLAEYREDICVGGSAAVYIKNIIPDKMKVKLVIVDTFPAPRNKRKKLRL